MDNDNIIGNGIRGCRKEFNYSQAQFAKALGISLNTLAAYESGKTIPDMVTIIKIANILHTSTDDILGVRAPKSQEYEENKEDY